MPHMTLANFNWLDNVILVVFLISIFAGLARGLVKEMLGLITWAAAFTVATLFSSNLANFFQQHMTSADGTSATLSLGTSFVILFVGTLVVGAIINYFISRAVEVGGISFANRLLGAVFGLARGFLLVIFAIFLVQLTPAAEKEVWQTSQFVNSLQPAVKAINDYLATDIEKIKTRVGDTLKNASQSKSEPATKEE